MKKTQVAKSMLNPWSNIFSNWVLTWINHGVNIFKTHGCFFSYLTHEKNGVQAQAGGIVYVTGRSSPGKESAGKPREGVDKNPGKVMVSLGKWSTNGGFPHPIWNHIYIICIICHIYDIYIYISCIYICILYMYIIQECMFVPFWQDLFHVIWRRASLGDFPHSMNSENSMNSGPAEGPTPWVHFRGLFQLIMSKW